MWREQKHCPLGRSHWGEAHQAHPTPNQGWEILEIQAFPIQRRKQAQRRKRRDLLAKVT